VEWALNDNLVGRIDLDCGMSIPAHRVRRPDESHGRPADEGGGSHEVHAPFEATKQQLFAYYKVEADDEEHALEMAARIPGARSGTIEVRPVMTFD